MSKMLQSDYLTENDLKNFGFKSIGTNVRISTDARIYGSENISIGNNVRIDDFVILSSVYGYINIGNQVFIGRNSHLSGVLGIELGDFCGMAANTVIYSASDDNGGDYLIAQAVPKKYTARVGGPVLIGKHVYIGSACSIIGPCTLGEGCCIGAMSLVHKDLEPWGIYIRGKRVKDRKKGLLALERKFLKEQND